MRANANAIIRLRWLVAAVAAVAALPACGASDSLTPATSDDIVPRILIDGDGQRGFVGELLQQPITVHVVDSALRPLPGRRQLRFAVAEGGGSVSDTLVLSDEAGRATITWVLGPAAGLQHFTVRFSDTPSSAGHRVFAQALPLDAADRVVVSGGPFGMVGVLVRKDQSVTSHTLVWPDTVLRLMPRTAEGGWEEVTAFTVGHPPESVVRPWTEAADTVRIVFRPPIAVPLAVWITHDFDTTTTRARHDLAALDGMWRSSMSGLRVGAVRIERAPGVMFQCGQTPDYFDAAAINIYYTEFPSPFACDARIIRMHRNNPFSFSDGYQFILAHEIGHSMSLGHSANASNVMWPESPLGSGLTTGQIYWMHFHNWGALNSVMNVHPPAERNCNVLALAHCPPQTFVAW